MYFAIGILLWLMGMVGVGMGGRPHEFIDVPSVGIVGMGMLGLLCIGDGRTVLIMEKALFRLP